MLRRDLITAGHRHARQLTKSGHVLTILLILSLLAGAAWVATVLLVDYWLVATR